MIDWYSVASNSLWILGCALALAALSYTSWLASVSGEKFRRVIQRPGIQTSLNLAGLLFSAGLAATSDSTLESMLWAVLGLLFLLSVIQIRRSVHTNPGAEDANSAG